MPFRHFVVAVILNSLLSCNAGFNDIRARDVTTFGRPPPVGIVCDELAEAIEKAKVVLYRTLHIDFDCPPGSTPPPLPPTTLPPPPPPTTSPIPPTTTLTPPSPTTLPLHPPTTTEPPPPTTTLPPLLTTAEPPSPTTTLPPPPTTTEPPPLTTTVPPPPTTTLPPPPTTAQPPPPTTTLPPPPTTTEPPPPTTTVPPQPTTILPPPPTTTLPPPPTTTVPPPPTTTEIIDSSFSSLSFFDFAGPISEASDNGGTFIGDGVECFTRPDAADYRGTISVTSSGQACIDWGCEKVEAAYREKFGNDANYCRNTAAPHTDGTKRRTAWCYVAGPAGSWGYCDVGEFQDQCGESKEPPDVGEQVCDGKNLECYEDRFGADYLGHVSRTVSGRVCQMWNIDYPHKRKNKYKPGRDSVRFGDHNYCRNIGYQRDGKQLSNRRRPWCYTTDPDVKWEYCDVGLPCDKCEGRKFDENEDTLYVGSYPECYLRNDASDYRGFVNYTRSGLPCQRWLQQLPHPVAKGNVMLFGHHDNYCRIRRHAYRRGKKPFCFTTDPDVEWEYCEVGDRHEVCLNEHLKLVAPYVGYRPECYTEKDGQDYRGFVSTTVSGYTCEYWRDRVNNKKYHKAFKTEENYCRTLGIEAGPGRGKPWCFIKGHPTIDWEYCDVGPRYRVCIDEYIEP